MQRTSSPTSPAVLIVLTVGQPCLLRNSTCTGAPDHSSLTPALMRRSVRGILRDAQPTPRTFASRRCATSAETATSDGRIFKILLWNFRLRRVFLHNKSKLIWTFTRSLQQFFVRQNSIAPATTTQKDFFSLDRWLVDISQRTWLDSWLESLDGGSFCPPHRRMLCPSRRLKIPQETSSSRYLTLIYHTQKTSCFCELIHKKPKKTLILSLSASWILKTEMFHLF